MPPKSPAKSAKGKKGKLSKADKERLKKEEQDQKLQEEEEARLKAEQEERERLDRERLEKDERQRREAAEGQRHASEVNELLAILDANATSLTKIRNEERAKAKWDRYMRCDGSPDPTVAAEVNTYMNLAHEDTQRNDIDSVIKDSRRTMDLISELHHLLESAPPNGLPDLQADSYSETINDLQGLLRSKIDAATLLLLKAASSMADTETGNLEFVKSSSEFSLMIWGNLTKNPRFKSFEFESQKFLFELPKNLAQSEIAVRVVRTRYDHYSHQCRTFLAKTKRTRRSTSAVILAASPTHETDGELDDGGEITQDKPNEETEEEVTETVDGKEDVGEGEMPVQPESEADKIEETGNDDENGNVDEDEEDVEDFDQEDEDTVDLRAYQVLGGVVHVDLLALPPQPKQVKSWVMTKVSGNELIKISYPTSDNRLGQTLSGTITMGQTLDVRAMANAAAAAETLGAPPITISLRLCDDVVYSEEPQMAYWCPERRQWRLDGFLDIKYQEETRTLSFKTINFGPLACLQDRHINMPFQSWELRPVAVNHARFTVIAAIIEAEMEIKGSLCCLCQPSTDTDIKPELSVVYNKWMTPVELIKVLKASGVNLFPEHDSKKYVSIAEKDTDNEDSIYRQMALGSSHFALSWSKWNSECGPDKIIAQGCEKLTNEAPHDDEWSLLMLSRRRAMKLRITEFDEDFSEDYADGSQFHADLYHLVCELSTEAGLQRMNTTDYQFVNAVYQLLSATRIIAYS